MDFGAWLRHERLKKGWTMNRLAHQAGVSQGYISALETGMRRCPSLIVAARLSSGMGIPLWVAIKDMTASQQRKPARTD